MRLKIAAATTALAALTAVGFYTDWTLLQLFGRFGQDTATSVGYALNSRGEPFFVFDAGDSNAGRWERHVPDQFGGVAGTVWINGVAFRYGSAQDSTVNDNRWLYTQGSVVAEIGPDGNLLIHIDNTETEIRLTVQDSTYQRGNDAYLIVDDCEPNATVTIPGRRQPDMEMVPYLVRFFEVDSLGTSTEVLHDLISPANQNDYFLRRVDYEVYFALVDSLGMSGHYIGPVRINRWEDCP